MVLAIPNNSGVTESLLFLRGMWGGVWGGQKGGPDLRLGGGGGEVGVARVQHCNDFYTITFIVHNQMQWRRKVPKSVCVWGGGGGGGTQTRNLCNFGKEPI